MLSYQHLYHAGNMADVHKHSLLAWMLQYLTQKEKPVSYIETHAGRALYDLTSDEAIKTGEAAEGINRVLAANWFSESHPYLQAITKIRAQHGPQSYPGSPLLAAETLRPTDSLHLAELHPQESTALEYAMSPYRARCYTQDGFTLAQSLCPPMPRRGMLVIDPSYEMKSEYGTLPGFIRQIHRKWPVGIIVLWYPLLTTGTHHSMVEELAHICPAGLRHEVAFAPARPGHKMIGSGLFVINPPFALAPEAARMSRCFKNINRNKRGKAND